jgi:hypothetical protein
MVSDSYRFLVICLSNSFYLILDNFCPPYYLVLGCILIKKKEKNKTSVDEVDLFFFFCLLVCLVLFCFDIYGKKKKKYG